MAKKETLPGIRLNKYISDSGFCSRREADKLITDERVTINAIWPHWAAGSKRATR